VAGRIDGSDMKQGYASSLGKPYTADGGETDTAFEEDDLIAWATYVTTHAALPALFGWIFPTIRASGCGWAPARALARCPACCRRTFLDVPI
jgi:hypothetical protein